MLRTLAYITCAPLLYASISSQLLKSVIVARCYCGPLFIAVSNSDNVHMKNGKRLKYFVLQAFFRTITITMLVEHAFEDKKHIQCSDAI